MSAPDLKAALMVATKNADLKNYRAPRRPERWHLLAFGAFFLFAISFAGERDYQDAVAQSGLPARMPYSPIQGEPATSARPAPIALIPVAPQGCKSFVAQRTTGPWEVKCYERKGK